MPFDGVVAKCVVNELNELLSGGRVEKIFQPEPDEIILNIRAGGKSHKVLMSSSPSYPRVHTTVSERENPAAPPMFCMLLRKYLAGGRVIRAEFHDYERIITLHIESSNELGDVSVKKLLIEIMGRHSNIILLNHEDKIIDSIKHVDNEVSSVREVMPARPYALPPAQDKTSPEALDIPGFIKELSAAEIAVEKYLLEKVKGFSPLLCREICYRAGINGKHPGISLKAAELDLLRATLSGLMEILLQNSFSPCIVYNISSGEDIPQDFHCLDITMSAKTRQFDSMNEVLDVYYESRDRTERLRQKKADVLKVLSNNIDRCNKKLAIHQQTLREVSDRDRLKLYGELITANIYCIPANTKAASLLNYYSENGEYVTIPLDEHLTPQENAQRYYKKYTKAKSAYAYTSQQLADSLKELEYLESVLQMLENCKSLQEIEEVRNELEEEGYLHRRRKKQLKNKKHREKTSLPLMYKSGDGFEILVGKNNRQNDELTLRLASSSDIWLHTQKIPGSHTIIRRYGKEVPDSTLLEAAMLAALHSKARMSANVPVDYTAVKNVKKPPGAKPGMVIYDNYKTIIVTPDKELSEKLAT